MVLPAGLTASSGVEAVTPECDHGRRQSESSFAPNLGCEGTRIAEVEYHAVSFN
jgi:hypothetical protein